MVTPNEDLRLGESVRDDKKLVAAHVISTLFRRLDRRGQHRSNLGDIPQNMMPLNPGLLIENNKVTNLPALIPLSKINNCDTSGSTRSGKSYLQHVWVEEIAEYDNVNILMISLRNQDVGVRLPQNQKPILSMYPDFGLKVTDAKGYKCFRYFAPSQSFGEKLPEDLSELGRMRAIVCLKWLPDSKRCTLLSKILDSIFNFYLYEETEKIRFALFVDEAQLVTKRGVPEEAKAAASKAEISLERFTREGLKYGCCVFVASQNIKDFTRQAARVRQNCNTKVFFRSDSESAMYASPYIGDSREIIHLAPQCAILHNAELGVIKLKVRPPKSLVWDFSVEETRKIVSGSIIVRSPLSNDALQMLELVKALFNSTGKGINLSEAAKNMGISSKRRLHQLVDELENGGYVRTRMIREKGQPRIIEPITNGGAD